MYQTLPSSLATVQAGHLVALPAGRRAPRAGTWSRPGCGDQDLELVPHGSCAVDHRGTSPRAAVAWTVPSRADPAVSETDVWVVAIELQAAEQAGPTMATTAAAAAGKRHRLRRRLAAARSSTRDDQFARRWLIGGDGDGGNAGADGVVGGRSG